MRRRVSARRNRATPGDRLAPPAGGAGKSSEMRLSLIEAPAVVRSDDARRGAIVDNASILIQIILRRGRTMVKKARSRRTRNRTLRKTAKKRGAADPINLVRGELSKADLRRRLEALVKLELAFLAILERPLETAGAGRGVAATSGLRRGYSERFRRPCNGRRRRRGAAGRKSGRETEPCSARSARGRD
jgi:hypothetical protein